MAERTITQKCPVNGTIKLNRNTFSNPGYEFVGWSLEDSSTVVAYEDEADITVADSDINLYAVWKSSSVIDPVDPVDPVDPTYSKSPIHFIAEEAGGTVKLDKCKLWNEATQGELPPIDIQYSTDGRTWSPYTIGTDILLPTVGSRVYFRAIDQNDAIGIAFRTHYNFYLTKKASVEGNIMSLLYKEFEGKNTISQYYCFTELFEEQENLTSAENLILPATTLSKWCYSHMFRGCTSLVKAPALPAMTLDRFCYNYMFSGCTSLTQAPELPATTLDMYCYTCMFDGCTSLTQAPELKVETLYSGCYSYMFRDCSSLTEAPALPATTLSDYCYSGMFVRCTSLMAAPALPATTLDTNCYSDMFLDCPKFTTVKMKSSMSGKYIKSTHGEIRKTVNYVL